MPQSPSERVAAWPVKDYSRIPNSFYHDPGIYELEKEKIFQGMAWLFLGFEAEIPGPGDFRTSSLGSVPVVYNRAADGSIHAFVNRCSHRGSTVRRELGGNVKEHECIYHRWTYDLTGNLTGVPFEKGVRGVGGMSKGFDKTKHGLRKLRVETFRGLIFATFSEQGEKLTDYLGSVIADHLTRVIKGPVRILGYQRQRIRGNWKLYAENTRDQYHGSLLHKFQGTFITQTNTEGGLFMDARHRHSIIFSTPKKTFAATGSDQSVQAGVASNVASLRDGRILRFIEEFGDDRGSTICSFFPNATFQQIRNSLATRQIRPLGPDAFDLFWTLFGFESDDEEMTHHRLLQLNMGGPAGYVSSEDGEAIELVQSATAEGESWSIVEMGGGGEIPDRVSTRMNDLAVRGFWSYYSELMQIAPPGGVK
ncbi:MAG: 3-phenylpropionate dioxygenase [Betaproteobacteria bacterium]|nr:3-phenylpropionate dioxygenase [Betaproteobacteria bacterium]